MTQPLEVEPNLREYEEAQWNSYIAVIGPIMPEYRDKINFAYHFAQDAHRGQLRATGEPYFIHPRATSLILLDAGITDPELHIVALLHDVPEDSFDFISTTVAKLQHPRIGDDWTRLATLFYDERVADMTAALTKPFGFDEDNEETKKQYYGQLEDALYDFPEVLLVKMADRLHNLRTLDVMPMENQKSKVQETIDIYFPLFEEVVRKYPEPGGYMLLEMKKAIDALGYTL